MLINHDNRLGLSESPHSLSNVNSLTVPGWGDNNYFIQTQKLWNGAGFQGISKMGLGNSGGSVDGRGCKSTGCTGRCCGGGMNGLGGLFEGDWGIWEYLIVGGLAYMAWVGIFKPMRSTTWESRRKRKRRSLVGSGFGQKDDRDEETVRASRSRRRRSTVDS